MIWFLPMHATLEWMVFLNRIESNMKLNGKWEVIRIVYMYMHIYWTGYSKEAREEE